MLKKLIIIMAFVALVFTMIFNIYEKQVAFAQKAEVLYLNKCLFDDDKDLKKHTATIISEHETIGYFTQITWGDYYHFCIKDENGKEYGFFIAINKDIDWKAYENFENKKQERK